MKRIPPSTQMQEALRADLAAGFSGHPLRQFVPELVDRNLLLGAVPRFPSAAPPRQWAAPRRAPQERPRHRVGV
jgi:hypothetical protein